MDKKDVGINIYNESQTEKDTVYVTSICGTKKNLKQINQRKKQDSG